MKGDLTACEFHFEKTHIYVYLTPLYLESLQIACIGCNIFAHGLQFSSGSFLSVPFDTGTGLAFSPLLRALSVNTKIDNSSDTRNQVKQNKLLLKLALL